MITQIWDALRNFVPFVQLKKREKHPKKVIFVVKLETKACSFTKSNTSSRVIFTFNCYKNICQNWQKV